MPDQTTGGAASPSLGFGALLTPMPSLDWALWKLTGVWAQDGEMISCPLPGHADSTPSFNLWAPDEEGVPQRFGCFGCARNGTVLDLIADMERLDGPDLILRAGELAEEEGNDGQERKRAVREEAEPRDFRAVVEEYDRGLTARRLAVLQNFMRDKGLGGEELEQYALDEWGWTVSEGTVVAMPHRTENGTVVGIKYRTGARKWNEPGSKFPALYGAWRDKGQPAVVLCEGETDTVWAAWQLRDEPVDVMGLPSGVNQPIQDEWLARLADRTLVIALDADEPGMEAAKRWTRIRPDAHLVRLPEGEDLLSCGQPVKGLIERSEVPRKTLGLVVVSGGLFARQTKDGPAPIADFAYTPRRELLTDKGPAWDVRLPGGQEALIRNSDMTTSNALARWSNEHGHAWLGSRTDHQGLLNWTKAASAYLPLEIATTKAGRIGRSFVSPGLCIGPDRMRYVPPPNGDARLDTRLELHEGPWNRDAILALEQLNDPATMAIVLGWLTATLLRGAVAPAPPLFVSGESGAGKTNLLNGVLSSLGFLTETNLTTTTPYGVDCMVNSTVGFPVWFDEYRGGAREDSMSRLRQMLRDAFYGQPSIKGGMTNNATELTEVSTWAGIIVSGEMGSGETSHRDRMVMLELNPDARNRDALAFLNGAETYGMGHALLTFLSQRNDALFKVQPLGTADLPDRFREVMGFVSAGWDAWCEFRWAVGLEDVATPPDYVKLASGREAADDPWIEALKACEGKTTYGGDLIVEQTPDGVLVLAGEVVVEAKRLGIELPARSNELVSWLRRRYTLIDKRTLSRRRAWLAEGMVL